MSVKNDQPNQPATVMGDALARAGVKTPVATDAPPAQPAPSARSTQSTHQEPKMSQTTTTAEASLGPRGPQALNRLWKRPMSRTPIGEQLSAYIEALKEVANAGIEDENFKRALSFDVLTTTAVPTILASLTMSVDGVTHVGVYELLVEKGVEGQIADRTLNDAMGPVTLRRTTADAADVSLWRTAEATVRGRVGETAQVHFAGSMVLPRDLSEKDVDHMRQVMYRALQAVYTVLEESTGGGHIPFSLKELTDQASLSVALDYAPGLVTTSTGVAIRSDIHVSLRATEIVNQNQDNLVQRRQIDLTHVDGFIDFVWNPPAPPQYYGAPQKTQQWNPRFVMTRVDTDLDAITLPGKLLALATAFAVGNNYAWAGAFLPRFASHAMRHGKGSKSDVELRDLGALGLEADLYGQGLARQSVLNSKTSDEDMRVLVASTINPETVFTLKIDEVGESAWLDGVFMAAARGDINAYNHIVASANELTKGEFERRWDKNKPIAIDDKVREHTGFYLNRQDQTYHDIAEIDYLAMLNIHGDKDMDKVRRWQATYDQTEVSVARRQADRLTLIEEVLGSSYITLTGNAERCTLTADFLRTLVDSVVAAGADIRHTNQQLDFTGAAGRQQYNLSQVALSPAQMQGLFNQQQNRQYTGAVSGVYARTY